MDKTALKEKGEVCSFQVGNLEIKAVRWGRKGAYPVIALHGWLDNAASFDFLAPYLADSQCDLICIDCAGHGLSSSREHIGAYNIWQDVGELFSIAEQLGWEQFSLIGHSRGAMVALLAAGTFPERINKLVLLEGGAPRTASPEQAPVILAEAIRTVRIASARPRNYYPSFEAAVAARVDGIFPIAKKDAEALANRGVCNTEKGFYWAYDPKLLAGSEVRLTLEQAQAFRKRIAAETLVVLGDAGFILKEDESNQFLSEETHWQRVVLTGGHHLHMHEQCEVVAELILDHFAHI